MSNPRQAVTGIVGGVIGFAIGGPQGAAYGFQIGLVAGSVLFPTQLPGVEGPRLTDNRQTTSVLGSFVPELWGTDALSGSVMWLQAEAQEHVQREEVGGKGAPTQTQTTFTYTQSVAIALCAYINDVASILRIWENGELVYDVRPQFDDESDEAFAARMEKAEEYGAGFTLYRGGEDQMPDPTIELEKGVGNVPPWRGLMYVVYHDRLLRDEQARRLPNFKFEVTAVLAGICQLEFSGQVMVSNGDDPETFSAGAPDPEEGWSPTTGHLFRVLSMHILPASNGGILREPQNPCLPFGDPDYYNETMWTAAYNAAVIAGKMPPGQTYGNQYPDELYSAYVRGGVPRYDMEPAHILKWIEGDVDPRNPENFHTYKPAFSTIEYDSLAEALANAEREFGGPATATGGLIAYSYTAEGFGIYNKVWPWHAPLDFPVPYPPVEYRHGGPNLLASQEFDRFVLFFAPIPVQIDTTVLPDSLTKEQADNFMRGMVGKVYFGQTPSGGSPNYLTRGYSWSATNSPAADTFYDFNDDTPRLYGYAPTRIIIRRVDHAPPVLEGEPEWQRVDEVNWSWAGVYTQLANPLDQAVGLLPVGPARPAGHPDWASAEFWNNAQAANIAAGLKSAISTTTYGSDYGYARVVCESGQTSDGVSVSLAEIVAALCVRSGLDEEDFDVSDLEGRFVRGYVRTKPTPARTDIDLLRQVGFYDVVEADSILYFYARGQEPVATLTEEDLGAYFGDDAPPPKIDSRMIQAPELPRQVRLHYRSPLRDYEAGEQRSPTRIQTDAVNEADTEVPVSIDDDAAARASEILMRDAWASRWVHNTVVGVHLRRLRPAQAVLVPMDARLRRMRIISIDDEALLIRKLALVRDDDGNYVSTAVGAPSGRTPNRLIFRVPSELVLMDLPMLRDDDNDAGVYGAIRSTVDGATWGGATIYRGTDGENFEVQQAVANEARIGVVNLPPAAGITTTWDDASYLEVTLTSNSGGLQNRTMDAVLTGANAAAIGVNGRWEILQFMTAELIGPKKYRLSNLLRGRRGTEHFVGTAIPGDRFVLVSGPGIVRVDIAPAERNVPFYYRVVTNGLDIATGTDQIFTSEGRALEPYSPVNLRATRQDDGDTLLEWWRRDRIGHELTSGQDMAMSESAELYAIDVSTLDTGAAPVRTLTSDTSSVEYSLLQRTQDFGPDAVEVLFTVHQVSSVVGRGPGAELIVAYAADATEYPSTTADIELAGTFSAGLSFEVTATFLPRTGASAQVTSKVNATGKASLADMAEELRAELGAGLPSPVVVSRAGAVVTLFTTAGTFSITQRQLVVSVFVNEVAPAKPVATAGRQQAIMVDLWTANRSAGNADFVSRAPDSDLAYKNGGSILMGWTVSALKWDVAKAMNYGVPQSVSGFIPNNIWTTRAGALGGAGNPEVIINPILALFPQYIDAVSFQDWSGSSGTPSSRPGLLIRMKPGYTLNDANTFNFSNAFGSHPSGFVLESEQVDAGIQPYPDGNKQRIGWSYNSWYTFDGELVKIRESQVINIVVDGHTYSHTITSGEAANIDAAYETIVADFKSQINAAGLYAAYGYATDNTAALLDIEALTIDTPMVITSQVITGLSINVDIQENDP